jgi:hypothetical protein
VPPAPADLAPSPPVVASAGPDALSLKVIQARWPDVVEHVLAHRRIQGLSRALVAVEDGEHGQRLVLGFGNDVYLNRAQAAKNRQALEDSIQAVLGRRYALRYTRVSDDLDDDPVISYAVRAFGGQPRRIDEDVSS